MNFTIINARKIGEYTDGLNNPDNYYAEALYKSDTGNFYLLRIDNDTKKHDIYFQGHRKYAYNVFTITNEDAKSWTKKYLSYERYVEIFGEPEK